MRRAGLLRDYIKIQEVIKTKDDFGGSDFYYKDLIMTKARVVFRNGERNDDVNELKHSYTIEFTIRGYHQVKDDMVVEYRGKKYRILSIDDTIRDQKTIITELIND